MNNAGIASRQRLPQVDLDVWNRALAVNVTGPLLGMQILRPLMGPGASIVNVVSIAGLSAMSLRHTPRASGRSAASPASPRSSSGRRASA